MDAITLGQLIQSAEQRIAHLRDIESHQGFNSPTRNGYLRQIYAARCELAELLDLEAE